MAESSSSVAGADKVLLASIVQYLARVATQPAESSADAIQVAIDALVANMELSQDDFAASSCSPPLEAAFSAASAAKPKASGEPHTSGTVHSYANSA